MWGEPRGDPDMKIPEDAKTSSAPLGRVYLYLGWSLKVYHDLDSYKPLTVFEGTQDIAATLNSMTDRQKSARLDELYEQSRSMQQRWIDAQGQFESIQTSLTAFEDIRNTATPASKPLRSAGETIEDLCRDRVDRYAQQYDRLIDQVKDTLDANISVFDKRLSIAILVLTLPTVILQLYGVWDVSQPVILTLLVVLFYVGAIFVLFSGWFDS